MTLQKFTIFELLASIALVAFSIYSVTFQRENVKKSLVGILMNEFLNK